MSEGEEKVAWTPEVRVTEFGQVSDDTMEKVLKNACVKVKKVCEIKIKKKTMIIDSGTKRDFHSGWLKDHMPGEHQRRFGGGHVGGGGNGRGAPGKRGNKESISVVYDLGYGGDDTVSYSCTQSV